VVATGPAEGDAGQQNPGGAASPQAAAQDCSLSAQSCEVRRRCAAGEELILGDTVWWVRSDRDIPEGTVGQIASWKGTERAVMKIFTVPQKQYALKCVELRRQVVVDSKGEELRPGDSVTWLDQDHEIPAGTAGQIVAFTGIDRAVVEMPSRKYSFPCAELAKHRSTAEEATQEAATQEAATQEFTPPEFDRNASLDSIDRLLADSEGEAAETEQIGQCEEQPVETPAEFRCKLSGGIMEDPVLASDGYSYERSEIKGWLAEHDVSPQTGLVLAHKTVVPNHALRQMIRAWREDGSRAPCESMRI